MLLAYNLVRQERVRIGKLCKVAPYRLSLAGMLTMLWQVGVAGVAADVAARGRHDRELDGELGRPDAAPAMAQTPSAKLPPRRQNQDEQRRPKTPHFRREEGLSDWHCC